MSRCKYKHLDWLSGHNIKCRDLDFGAEIQLDLILESVEQNRSNPAEIEVENWNPGIVCPSVAKLTVCKSFSTLYPASGSSMWLTSNPRILLVSQGSQCNKYCA
jgi:hypothetical protein